MEKICSIAINNVDSNNKGFLLKRNSNNYQYYYYFYNATAADKTDSINSCIYVKRDSSATSGISFSDNVITMSKVLEDVETMYEYDNKFYAIVYDVSI